MWTAKFLLWASGFGAQLSGLSVTLDTPEVGPNINVRELKRGRGPTAEAGVLVTVHFVVSTPQGKDLVNTHKRGMPYTFRVGDEGTPEFLQLMVAGMHLNGARKTILPPQ